MPEGVRRPVNLFSEAFTIAERGGNFDSSDFGDEGEHGFYSQLCDSHDEGFTAGLHLLLQLLLAVYLHHYIIPSAPALGSLHGAFPSAFVLIFFH